MGDRTHIFLREDLWQLISDEDKDHHHSILQEHVASTLGSKVLTGVHRQKISTFLSEVRKKLEKYHRNKTKFATDSWLQGYEEFGKIVSSEIGVTPSSSSASAAETLSSASSSSGRKAKEYSESSERTKRRKVQNLLAEYPVELLCDATKAGLKQRGQVDTAALLTECIETTPTRGKNIRSAWQASSANKQIRKYSPEEALALMIDLRQSVGGYEYMRKSAKERNCDIYPIYNRVLDAKKCTYPAQENITVTESSGCVTLQGLLDVTTRRLLLNFPCLPENLSKL